MTKIQLRLLATVTICASLFTGCSVSQKYYHEIQLQRKSEAKQPFVSESTLVDSAQLISDLKYLSSDELEGRYPATKGSYLAQTYIINRLRKNNVDSFSIAYKQRFAFSFKGKNYPEATNLTGIIHGTLYPDSFIVLSAHYDHLGIKDSLIYNGADDNASGVCALLSFVDYFSKHKPAYSFVFCFFDGEEEKEQGSYYFVDHAPFKISAVKININMDMISRNDKGNEIIVAGSSYHPELKNRIIPFRDSTNVSIIFGHDKPKPYDKKVADWTYGSDHEPFFVKGVKFIAFEVESTPDYHQAGDEFEKIDKGFYTSVVNLICKIVIEFDKPLPK